MYSQTKSIKVSDITHKHLSRLGRKNDSFDYIIGRLIQEHLIYNEMARDIQKIKKICGDKKASEFSFDEKVNFVREVFDEIDFDMGIYPEWGISQCLETAMDEDLIGSGATFGDRELPMSEIVVNCYCLYLQMPSPTFGTGAMTPPL